MACFVSMSRKCKVDLAVVFCSSWGQRIKIIGIFKPYRMITGDKRPSTWVGAYPVIKRQQPLQWTRRLRCNWRQKHIVAYFAHFGTGGLRTVCSESRAQTSYVESEKHYGPLYAVIFIIFSENKGMPAPQFESELR